MKRIQRAIATLILLSLLLPSYAAWADEEQAEVPAVNKVAEGSVVLGQETDNAPVHTAPVGDDALCRQIKDTYKAAKRRAHRHSFKGYCGAYVANQLVVLGINKSYLSANGKNTYDIYRRMSVTSGGYRIKTYSAKIYTLFEAIRAIMDEDPSARNILVGFQRSTSKSGRKYGHVLFIHGIKNGKIHFSDSCARTIDDVKYREGEPIVCSLSSFVQQYAKCKLDGVVHFEKLENGQKTKTSQRSVMSDTALASFQNEVAFG